MTTFVEEECCACGIAFGMTPARRAHLIETKQIFYCPTGHGQHFTKSVADRLREQLATKDQEIVALTQKVEECTKPKRRGRKKRKV